MPVQRAVAGPVRQLLHERESWRAAHVRLASGLSGGSDWRDDRHVRLPARGALSAFAASAAAAAAVPTSAIAASAVAASFTAAAFTSTSIPTAVAAAALTATSVTTASAARGTAADQPLSDCRRRALAGRLRAV